MSKLLHKDIRITFKLYHQPFEAVGFLETGEETISGEQIVRRMDNGYIVADEREWQLVCDYWHELPQELWQYWLVTARAGRDAPGSVSYLYFNPLCSGWNCSYVGPGIQWGRDTLVLRLA